MQKKSFAKFSLGLILSYVSVFALVSFSLLGMTKDAEAYKSPGVPTGYVNDFANILSGDEISNLESRLIQFNQETTNEIAVVTIPSLGDETIESYAEKLFKEWGIGDAEKDNGVLLLVAVNDRKLRIETGYGLEGALPDATASYIIRRDITPSFQSNNFYEGIMMGVEGIISATKGEYKVEEKALNSWEKFKGLFNEGSLNFIFVFGIIIFQFIASLLAKSKSWWLGGVLGLIIGIVVSIFVSIGLFYKVIALVFFVVMGLIFDFALSHGNKKGRGGGGWISGGSGTNFGGGGGFGGFSGGSSGGGGASGRW